MKFTMSLPIGVIAPGEFQNAAAIAEMGRALEAAQVDACYLTDHPAPSAEWLRANGHDALDPFTAFGFVAASTTRLMLHTNILVMAYRNPFLTAKAAATLQVLSGGRLILGAGAGYQKAEFEALGADFHKRGADFDEALKVIRMAWAGGPVVYQGRTFNAVGNEPRPVPPVQPPIWIGGGSGKALERAALLGDGWCPFFAAPTMSASNRETGIHTIEQLADNIARLHEMRAAHGRTGQFDIAIGAKAALDFGTRESAENYCDAVRKLGDAGITWTMIDPPHASRQNYLECAEWFGQEVIANLR